jgi:antiviral helicase SKI2
MEFKYPLDTFQIIGCQAIDNNENVLATAHTGSGKTTLALYAIARCVKLGKKVIYTSPIKTLSNQKFKEFSNIFPDVGIITGDIKINPSAQCLIMTAEILKNSLLRKHNDTIYDWNFNPEEVDIVILDEVHFINNPERGKVWEEIIMNLSHKIKLVMLSATISGANEMIDWITDLKKIKCHLVSTNKRPVPLKHAIYWDDEINIFLENDTQWNHLVWSNVKKNMDKYLLKNRFSNIFFHNCLKYLQNNNLMPVTVFLLNREAVESQAKTLPQFVKDHLEAAEIVNIWNKHLNRYKSLYEHTTQWNMLYDLVCKGIGIHHSGMIPILKEIVEILYDKGLLKVLLATETFAMGVNMPTKTTIFTNLTKFDGNQKRNLRPEEYGQMAGRAGRRGIDTSGLVLILPFLNFISENEAKTIMLSPPQKINSKLSLDYSLILKLLNYKIDENNSENVIDYLANKLKNTLFNNQDEKLKNPIVSELNECNVKLTELNKYMTEELKEKLEIYKKIMEIDNKLKPDGFFKLDKKIEKKLLLEKKNFEGEINSTQIKILKSIFELEYKINKLTIEVDFNENKLKIHMDKMLQFLLENNMVDESYLLTKKGRIVGEVNECNPLIMAKIIENNILDELSFPEIAGLISIFIADKDKEEIYISDLEISNEEKNIIKSINSFSEQLYNDEIKLIQNTPYQFSSDWNLNYNMIEIVKEWANNKCWLEVKNKFNNFEGNFIKNILRLVNVLRNIENIASILNRNILLDKLNGYQEKLIRDIVITDSLYI